jgi:glycoside/pentoside/hexuronide:cation symporter, GPH family
MTPPIATHSSSRLRTKLAYGLGSVAFGIKDNGFGLFLMIYYNQVLGLPAQWVGGAIAIALFADAFIDPVIGHVSDHWRSRLGRRHPFMYVAALPVAVSYVALWNPPAGLSHGQLFFYLIGMAIVVRSFVSLYEVPSAALVAELTTDYNQRTSFLSYRYFFGWWGSMAISIMALSVFMRPDAEHPVGQLNPAGYYTYSIVSSLIMFVAILVSSLGTQRHVQDFVHPPAEDFDLKRYLREAKETFSNRGVAPLLGAGLFSMMAMGIGGSLLTYVNTYFWELSAQQLSVLTSASMIAAVLAIAVATRVSARFGKRNAAVSLHLVSMALMPLPPALRLLGLFPENGSPWLVPLLYASAIVTSTCMIVGSILWSSMTADVVEDSQLQTGRRSEGLLFSVNAFVMKCVSGLGLGMGGVILGLVAFPQNAQPGQVAEATLNRLLLVDIGLVSLFYLLSIACLAAYPITKAMHQANLRKLGQPVYDDDAEPPANPETAPPVPGQGGAVA